MRLIMIYSCISAFVQVLFGSVADVHMTYASNIEEE